jgi:hypothetical protein
MTVKELCDLLQKIEHQDTLIWVREYGGVHVTQSMEIRQVQTIQQINGRSYAEIVVTRDDQ